MIRTLALLALASCSSPAQPSCFRPGDTVGWIIVTDRASGDTIHRAPLEAIRDFCLE